MAWSKKARFLSPVEVLENPEEWDYFTDLELMKSRGSSNCMTCEHFTYTCDKSCVTLLTCPLHQCLIPQGEHQPSVVEIGSERESLILDWVLKLLNNPQNYFLKINELNYHC